MPPTHVRWADAAVRQAGTHRWRDLSVACANLDGMTGGVRAEAARVDPAAGLPVGTGRGERLLRRVLAGDPTGLSFR